MCTMLFDTMYKHKFLSIIQKNIIQIRMRMRMRLRRDLLSLPRFPQLPVLHLLLLPLLLPLRPQQDHRLVSI